MANLESRKLELQEQQAKLLGELEVSVERLARLIARSWETTSIVDHTERSDKLLNLVTQDLTNQAKSLQAVVAQLQLLNKEVYK